MRIESWPSRACTSPALCCPCSCACLGHSTSSSPRSTVMGSSLVLHGSIIEQAGSGSNMCWCPLLAHLGHHNELLLAGAQCGEWRLPHGHMPNPMAHTYCSNRRRVTQACQCTGGALRHVGLVHPQHPNSVLFNHPCLVASGGAEVMKDFSTSKQHSKHDRLDTSFRTVSSTVATISRVGRWAHEAISWGGGLIVTT
ncbi:hypothetical protein CALCODRAFT_66474 [Calocera cornea HHB12733]|uniref:Uncharacterized protein n=1 Tax=Calocera cornea HHB12733 TaxID=1353952 RepID=A0A165DJQ0_9BASI|nr:hypothetical protein CALCODRAFT_66474 [Calocera cornea HHB12733]